MSAKEPVKIPSYCRDYVYNRGIKYADDATFSPNNIKRVILSPDGFYINLHTSNRPFFDLFNPSYANECFYNEKYKPMLTALASDLVCSNVEEIVYCVNSINGLVLPQAELNFQSMISDEKLMMHPRGTSEGDKYIKDELNKRFPRLRYVSIVPYHLQEFIKLMTTDPKIKEIDYAIAESDRFNFQWKIELNKDDWYKHIRLRPNYYKLDMAQGALDKRLSAIKKAIEEAKYNKQLSEVRDKKYGKYRDDILVVEKKLQPVLSCYIMLGKIFGGQSINNCVETLATGQRKHGISTLADISSLRTINEYDGLLNSEIKNSLTKIGITVNSVKSVNLTENVKEMCNSLALLNKTLYLGIVNFLLDTIAGQGAVLPIMTKTKLLHFDKVIYIPESLKGKAQSIVSFTGEPFDGKSIKDSIANACCLICNFVFCDVTDTYNGIKKYYKKETWLEVIERGKIS